MMTTHKMIDGELVELTPEEVEEQTKKDHRELAEADALARDQARKKRNRLLAESDVSVVRRMENGEDVSRALKQYRQALRDVPAQDGFPVDVAWPEKPE